MLCRKCFVTCMISRKTRVVWRPRVGNFDGVQPDGLAHPSNVSELRRCASCEQPDASCSLIHFLRARTYVGPPTQCTNVDKARASTKLNSGFARLNTASRHLLHPN